MHINTQHNRLLHMWQRTAVQMCDFSLKAWQVARYAEYVIWLLCTAYIEGESNGNKP